LSSKNVVPAKAGTQVCKRFDNADRTWVPACAGTTYQRARVLRVEERRSSVEPCFNQASEASVWLKVALGRITAFTLAVSGW
jgi:hypothetical protein